MLVKVNKYYLSICCVCLFIFLFSALSNTNIFEIIINFLTDEQFRENFSLAESSVKQEISVFHVVYQVLTNYPWQFDVSIIFGANLFQLCIPLIASVAGAVFYHKKNTYLKMVYFRSDLSFANQVWRQVCWESFKCAISVFLSYIIFFLFILFISKGAINNNVSRDFLKDLFGSNFYYSFPYLYYLIEGGLKFFIVPYIYAFFSCALVFICNDIKRVILIPNLYYFGLSVIGFGLNYIINDYALYINPSSVMVIGSLNNVNSIAMIMFSCIPVFISFLIIYRRIHDVEI